MKIWWQIWWKIWWKIGSSKTGSWMEKLNSSWNTLYQRIINVVYVYFRVVFWRYLTYRVHFVVFCFRIQQKISIRLSQVLKISHFLCLTFLSMRSHTHLCSSKKIISKELTVFFSKGNIDSLFTIFTFWFQRATFVTWSLVKMICFQFCQMNPVSDF